MIGRSACGYLRCDIVGGAGRRVNALQLPTQENAEYP
jgi:hypothetical protein